MDGTASGRIKCTLANWTGVAYKIPRTELDKCKARDDLKQSGVYFLFGTSDQTGENIVYIGQAGARKNGEGIPVKVYVDNNEYRVCGLPFFNTSHKMKEFNQALKRRIQ